MNDILSGTYKGNTYSIKVECYPNTPAIKVQLLPVNAGERITMTQNLGQPLPRYQAFLCDGMLEVDSTAFMDYMEENDLGYIVDYKRYDADVFTGVNRRTAAVFQFHSAALRRLNKVGCQRYEGDYNRSSHEGSVTYYGTVGNQYRGIVTVYAKDANGEDARNITTSAVIARK